GLRFLQPRRRFATLHDTAFRLVHGILGRRSTSTGLVARRLEADTLLATTLQLNSGVVQFRGDRAKLLLQLVDLLTAALNVFFGGDDTNGDLRQLRVDLTKRQLALLHRLR